MKNRISELRNILGLSQRELAQKCNIAKGVLIKAEHMTFDNCNIRLKTLMDIAEGLDVHVAVVLGIDKSDIKVPQKFNKRSKQYKKVLIDKARIKRERVLKENNG